MKKVKVYTVMALVFILICGAISFWTVYRIKYFYQTSKETEKLIIQTSGLSTTVFEAEIYLLNYATTLENEEFKKYEDAKVKIFARIDSLVELVTNDFQKEKLDSINQIVSERFKILDNAAAIITDPVNFESLVSNQRRANFSQYHLQIDKAIIAIEMNYLENLQHSNQRILSNLTALPIVIIFITLVGIFAAIITFYSLYQYNLHQEKNSEKIKAYQEQLENQIKQLNESNKELEQFAYVASHDLQEPLRKITSFSELLHDQYGNELEGDGKLYLDRIAFAATRMRKLITDLLEYSRAGRYVTEEESVDLNEIVQNIISDLEIQIGEKEAKLTIENLPTIQGHPGDWRMVFQNLISNALKFNDEDSKPIITITCQEAPQAVITKYFSKPALKGYFLLSVMDNGIGFNQEYAEKIFVIFQRLHGKDAYGGTGIGLAVCKKIIERYRGTIYAVSKLEKGTVFTILLPKDILVKH